MKWLVTVVFIQLWTKIATLTISVVSDPPNIINCPQPCTTLNDLLLNNSLSNISNVEFKLLPGVYNVTSNIVIQHVHNVSFVGVVNKSVSVVLKCFYRASLQVICSRSVTIPNLLFEQCGGYTNWLVPARTGARCQSHDALVLSSILSPSLYFACCFFISVNNIIIKDNVGYALTGYIMLGTSCLNYITLNWKWKWSGNTVAICSRQLYTLLQQYTILIINFSIQISSRDHSIFSTAVDAIVFRSDPIRYPLGVIISNSTFANFTIRESIIQIDTSSALVSGFLCNVLLTNCNFIQNEKYGAFPDSLVGIDIDSTHTTVTLLNCTFSMNEYSEPLLSVTRSVYTFVGSNYNCLPVSKINLINITFCSNRFGGLIHFHDEEINPTCMVQALLTGVIINETKTSPSRHLILIEHTAIHFNGNILIHNNSGGSIIKIDSQVLQLFLDM